MYLIPSETTHQTTPPRLSGRSAALGLVCLIGLLLIGCTTTPPTQEMSDARQSVEAAKQAGATKLAPGAIDSAEQLLTKAEVGMRSGNFEAAQQDAIAAREAARQALAISEVMQEVEPQAPPPEKRATVAPPPATVTYRVRKNESLWRIAARPELYGDPLLWPLLLKYNAQQIADADLIFPGQSIQVLLSATEEEKLSARQHALNRGAWHLGTIETADQRYLSSE